MVSESASPSPRRLIDLPGDVARTLRHPSRQLPVLAERATTGAAVTSVALFALISLGLAVAQVLLEPATVIPSDQRLAQIAGALLLPPFLVGFWWASAWLIDGLVRRLGTPGARQRYLAVSAYPLWGLVAFHVVRIAQALLDHSAGLADLSVWVGMLALVALAWYISLAAAAVRVVYDLPSLTAVAVALLPFAAIAALVLLLATVAGLTHPGG